MSVGSGGVFESERSTRGSITGSRDHSTGARHGRVAPRAGTGAGRTNPTGVRDERAAVAEAADRYAQQPAAGTDPSSLFRSFRETVAVRCPCGSSTTNSPSCPAGNRGSSLGFDEGDLLAARRMPRRESVDRIGTGVREPSEEELLSVLADAERERLELLAVSLIGELRERSEERSADSTGGEPSELVVHTGAVARRYTTATAGRVWPRRPRRSIETVTTTLPTASVAWRSSRSCDDRRVVDRPERHPTRRDDSRLLPQPAPD